ncbi:MAG: hypothetical protein Q4E06_01225 [Lautropia sp.]|nr:hypothetical protein [Lautropia sp.]
MVVEENPKYRKTTVGGRNLLLYRLEKRGREEIVIVSAIYVAGQSVNYEKMDD